jgi:Bacterial dnaA protein helix-turn-helix
MATTSFVPGSTPRRRVPLAEIDAIVSARLGTTRTRGNAQPACFNRQVAMYLAKHVGRWSTTAIGRFYNGRDHSTVCHGIQRIESLRETDPDVDALVTELRRQLDRGQDELPQLARPNKSAKCIKLAQSSVDEFAELVAARICAYIEERMGPQRPSSLSCLQVPGERKLKEGR